MKHYFLSVGEIIYCQFVGFYFEIVRVQNNLNGFSLINVHKNATLAVCFEGDGSCVFGNHCKFFIHSSVLQYSYEMITKHFDVHTDSSNY